MFEFFNSLIGIFFGISLALVGIMNGIIDTMRAILKSYRDKIQDTEPEIAKNISKLIEKYLLDHRSEIAGHLFKIGMKSIKCCFVYFVIVNVLYFPVIYKDPLLNTTIMNLSANKAYIFCMTYWKFLHFIVTLVILYLMFFRNAFLKAIHMHYKCIHKNDGAIIDLATLYRNMIK